VGGGWRGWWRRGLGGVKTNEKVLRFALLIRFKFYILNCHRDCLSSFWTSGSDSVSDSTDLVSVIVRLLDVDSNARTADGGDRVLLDVAFHLEAEKISQQNEFFLQSLSYYSQQLKTFSNLYHNFRKRLIQ
jgi:hypothetical protein